MAKDWGTHNILIGKMAKLHNMSPKMLRYWDRIGVLKPAVTNEINGYRYYTSEQFHILNFINYMRSMWMSYKEIKSYLDNYNHDSLLELLNSQIRITDEKIDELVSIRSNLHGLKKELEQALEIEKTEKIIIKTLEAREIIKIQGKIETRLELENLVIKLQTKVKKNSRILLPRVGLYIERDEFIEGNYKYDGIYVINEGYTDDPKLIEKIPAGEFATLYFWGKTEESYNYFAKMANYMRENDLEIIGNPVRRVVAPGMKFDDSGHLAEISVPIRKRCT